MKQKVIKTIPFDTKKSVRKALDQASTKMIAATNTEYDVIKRIGTIRKGLSYDTIEMISKRINRPVKNILSILNMPQTTYNKKKTEQSLLDSRNSELIMLINDLIDYGIEVFNQEEEKFQRWLRKPNLSLGGHTPESLLDTATGIEEVKFALNRIEFGNFA